MLCDQCWEARGAATARWKSISCARCPLAHLRMGGGRHENKQEEKRCSSGGSQRQDVETIDTLPAIQINSHHTSVVSPSKQPCHGCHVRRRCLVAAVVPALEACSSSSSRQLPTPTMKMINPNQNLLFVAMILALCVISFVHVFLFPLYDVDARRTATKTYFDFEQSLCMANIKPRRSWPRQPCPRYAIVTIVQGGRLGNQMWEYASVWALARRTGLEPYIPRCIQLKLEQVFESLSIPSFEDIGHCPIDVARFVRSLDAWNYTNQSVVLPRYSIQPDVVLAWAHDIVQEFTFRRRLRAKSQQVLRAAARNRTRVVYVGVHVRRTDYIGYLWRKHGVPPAEPRFYYSAMRHFETKFGADVLFVVVSDDPRWCQRKFAGMKNVYVPSRVLPNTPALDLAILAACNHSIFDYGTFGIWGAILAGGETVYYNLSRHSSVRVGQLLPNWHAMS